MIAQMTEADYISGTESYDGVCRACGDIQCGGVEPDAEKYECMFCGEHAVFGFELALVMGLIELVEERGVVE